MRSALYYPHTQIRDENFLKNALLLWDRVEYISPNRSFQFDDVESLEASEGLELLCRPLVPSSEQKNNVHHRVTQLLRHGTPKWLIVDKVPRGIKNGRPVKEFYGTDYGIYPEKLDHRTWRLLEAANLVRLSGSDYDYYTRPMVGLLLMSLLADACAGTQKEKITDRADAYQFLWSVAATEAKSIVSQSTLSGDRSNFALERLVGISIKVINTDSIPLANIVAMRKRESGGSGSDYRKFRIKYAEQIQACVKRLVAEAKTLSDWEEIERQFQLSMKDDLASLKEELGVAKRGLLFSKEMLAVAGASLSLFTEPVSASILLTKSMAALATGALTQDVASFSGNYKKALHGHAMSWLYLSQRPRRRNLAFGDLN
jgi:hypothetical protein